MIDSQSDQLRTMDLQEVHALSVHALGLGSLPVDLHAPEALAALVRRAASFLAPCSARVLRGATQLALDGLTGPSEQARDELRLSVDNMIEALTIYGDLLELAVDDPNENAATRMLYLAPPTYVPVGDLVFLLGGALDGGEPLPTDLRGAVEYRSHTRRLRSNDLQELRDQLSAVGWVELRRDLWLPAPVRESPTGLVEQANLLLTSKATTGDVLGLSILDPEASTTYYRGRWAEPRNRTGRFVARRAQRYGADRWSYVELAEGVVTHLVDLPFSTRHALRPCDAAWHLQMAIDALAGRPQQYLWSEDHHSRSVLVELFSPVPLWARRRWDVLGEEVPRSGSLFSYRFPVSVSSDVAQTLHADLWLTQRISS